MGKGSDWMSTSQSGCFSDYSEEEFALFLIDRDATFTHRTVVCIRCVQLAHRPHDGSLNSYQIGSEYEVSFTVAIGDTGKQQRASDTPAPAVGDWLRLDGDACEEVYPADGDWLGLDAMPDVTLPDVSHGAASHDSQPVHKHPCAGVDGDYDDDDDPLVYDPLAMLHGIEDRVGLSD